MKKNSEVANELTDWRIFDHRENGEGLRLCRDNTKKLHKGFTEYHKDFINEFN